MIYCWLLKLHNLRSSLLKKHTCNGMVSATRELKKNPLCFFMKIKIVIDDSTLVK